MHPEPSAELLQLEGLLRQAREDKLALECSPPGCCEQHLMVAGLRVETPRRGRATMHEPRAPMATVEHRYVAWGQGPPASAREERS